MTGDSENEIERPGDSSVPSDDPRPDGENSYRPFRGWASAYEPPPPSLWSRISGIFSRKPKAEEWEPDPTQPAADTDTDTASAADSEVEVDVRAEVDSEAGGEVAAESTGPVGELPVAPPEEFSYPYVQEQAEVKPARRGLFGRVFSRRSREETVQEPAEPVDSSYSPTSDVADATSDDEPVVPEIPSFLQRSYTPPTTDKPPAPRLSDPAFYFPPTEPAAAESTPSEEPPADPFAASLPMDEPDAQLSEVPLAAFGEEPVASFDEETPATVPPATSLPDEVWDTLAEPIGGATLDDALPAEPSDEPEPVVDAAAVEAEHRKKRGLFARLFGRKPKADQAELDLEPEPNFELAIDADPSATAGDPDAEVFASVDDALPFVEPDAPALPDTASFDAPPAVEATFETPEPIDATAFELPTIPEADVPAVSSEPTFNSRDTQELEPVAEPEPAAAADMLFGDTIDPADVQPAFEPSLTLDEFDVRPAPETAGRSTVPAMSLEDESTDEFFQPSPPEVDAAAEADRPPFFVPKFRSFYNEIVLYKHQKSEFTAGFATAIVDYNADLTPDHAAQGLSKRLQEILELQLAEASWMGGEAAARYPDAQYAMAVLADEMFTHMEWPGREAWPKYLLEQRIFKTHAADVEFFKRVDRLLKNEADNPTPAARDLARLYLLVLASGFRGKYRVPNLTRPLAEYRRRLYEFVYERDPLLLYGNDRRIFPAALERTMASRAVARFSMLQQWAAALIVILVGYTFIANFAWKSVAEELLDVTARVEAANRTSSSDGSWGSIVEDSIR